MKAGLQESIATYEGDEEFPKQRQNSGGQYDRAQLSWHHESVAGCRIAIHEIDAGEGDGDRGPAQTHKFPGQLGGTLLQLLVHHSSDDVDP